MQSYRKIMASFLAVWGAVAPLTANARPTVLELYTSQGCSSCPAAEALIHQLSGDPALITLSFHVTYFDSQGWKDPFASAANTQRQHEYAKVMGQKNVFTPQLIVDGRSSINGADEPEVKASIAAAQYAKTEVPVSITPLTNGYLQIGIGGPVPQPRLPENIVAYEIHFNRGGLTAVQAGENSGETLQSTNNVIRTVTMPLGSDQENAFMLAGNFPEDGVAVIVQQHPLGQVIGAAVYMRPQ